MFINSLYKFIAERLSPEGVGARLSILTYHRVLALKDPLFTNVVTQDTFDAQMSGLKAVFNVLPLFEAVARLKTGTLPARAACITFDDGYAHHATIVLPILQRHGLKATFFIATACLNGGRMFNDTVIEAIRRARPDRLDLTELGLGAHDLLTLEARARAIDQVLSGVKYLSVDVREAKVARLCELAQCGPLPDDLMMTTAQLKSLSVAGMEIGAHTAHHPILACLDNETVKQEIASGKQFLEDALAMQVRLFAYPNGKPGLDFLPEQAAIVRELGFAAAVSTQRGAAAQSSDPFQLPRFTPWHPGINYFVPELLFNLRRSRASLTA